MAGDILETIDNALDDYELSNDAMRWTPPTPRLELNQATDIIIEVYAACRRLIDVPYRWTGEAQALPRWEARETRDRHSRSQGHRYLRKLWSKRV